MRVLTILLNAVLFASATTMVAFGQERKTQNRSAPPETRRIFSLTNGLMGNLHSDATLTELRKGTKVESAVLDVCHNGVQGSAHKDRFVVTLTPRGNSLVGEGQSQEDKLPVNVILNRKKTADGYSFSGSITRGTTKYEIASDDNKDMSESEFSDSQSSKEQIVENPPNFAGNQGQDIPDISPNSISVKVKREALADLANELKKQKVKVYVDSLMTDCDALRSGHQIVNLQVDPNRAIALVDNLKKLPKVLSVGWGASSSPYTINDAVRIQGTEKTLIDRDHIASAIVAAEKKILGGTLESTSWDPQTGELSVKLKHTNQTIPQLSLTDSIQTTWLVSNESPKANYVVILWLGEIAVNINDDGPEPHLELLQPSLRNESADEDDSGVPNSDELIKAVAHELNGLVWDDGAKDWVSQRGQLDMDRGENPD
jgi:hypothetical protein